VHNNVTSARPPPIDAICDITGIEKTTVKTRNIQIACNEMIISCYMCDIIAITEFEAKIQVSMI